MSKGGRTATTWNSESKWRSGDTTTIRVPQAIKEEVKRCARLIDEGKAVLHGNAADEADIVLSAIAAYIELRRGNRHANQHNKELDINSRAWDELRKFMLMVKTQPEKLGLK